MVTHQVTLSLRRGCCEQWSALLPPATLARALLDVGLQDRVRLDHRWLVSSRGSSVVFGVNSRCEER